MVRFPSRLGRPVAWERPPPQPLAGRFRRNQALAGLARLCALPGTFGPESLAIGPDNALYAGFADGRIARFDTRGHFLRVIADTGGRPLGLRFHPSGDLIVCDARRGLLRIALTGRVTLLCDRAEGLRLGFADDLDLSADGRFAYFTDASRKWGFGEDHLDLIEHGGHGRFLRYDFATGEASVLLRGLQFCNGVALGPGEDWVLVTETGAYRVLRYWLKGERAGTHEVFIDNLPGFPDNIRFNGRDRFWLALPVPRNPALDFLAPHPLLRFAFLQYARRGPLPVTQAGMVLALDLDGRPGRNPQCHGKGRYSYITQALEAGPWLYVSSLHEPTLARIALADLESRA